MSQTRKRGYVAKITYFPEGCYILHVKFYIIHQLCFNINFSFNILKDYIKGDKRTTLSAKEYLTVGMLTG
jgi:hypothetical protein